MVTTRTGGFYKNASSNKKGVLYIFLNPVDGLIEYPNKLVICARKSWTQTTKTKH